MTNIKRKISSKKNIFIAASCLSYVKCGVQMLASVLKSAKCSSPVDMDRIKLALQGYNFGSGYITWAFDKYGGYSKANAIEYSKLQAKKAGASSYGDTEYVEHVLRYYPYGNYSYNSSMDVRRNQSLL